MPESPRNRASSLGAFCMCCCTTLQGATRSFKGFLKSNDLATRSTLKDTC